MFKNINQMLKQAQKMQSQIGDIQARLEQQEFEAQAGAGMVKAVVNGKGMITSVIIDKAILNADDQEMVQDLVKVAVNEARAKMEQKTAEEMGQVTQGLNLPGGMKLPF